MMLNVDGGISGPQQGTAFTRRWHTDSGPKTLGCNMEGTEAW